MAASAFYDRVRPLFPGGKLTAGQVDGLSRLLEASATLPLRHRAYVLATAQHETAHTMQPVRETLAATDASAINRLEAAWSKGRLPWVKTPYWRRDAEGKSWLGRGYVQLTHKANYVRASQKLGVDLVTDPNAAMNPDVAARILVRGMVEGWFTGRKMADFATFEDMRRVVNGTDRAADIARLARGYEAALLAAEGSAPPAPKPAPAVPSAPAPTPAVPAASAPLGWLLAAAVIAVILYVILKG